MCPMTFNRLESLSNELLLEIFEYLDAYNMYQAFYGLNHRISTLLQLTRLHILYDSTKKNKTVWDGLTLFFISLQIRILSSYNDINIDERFLLSARQTLHTICLHKVSQQYMVEIFELFRNDNQIKCLYLNEKSDFYDRKNPSVADLLLVDYGHQFISLVKLSLTPRKMINGFPIVPVIFLQLRYLLIKNYYWAPNLLRFLQHNTPNLRSLKLPGSAFSTYPTSTFAINHIHGLHINYPGSLVVLQKILSHFPHLRRLHVDWEYNQLHLVMDGGQWQHLIKTYLPHLKQLTIDFDQGIDEDIVETFYTGEFWSTRKVKVKMIVNKTQSRYKLVKTIYFGEEWHFGHFDNS